MNETISLVATDETGVQVLTVQELVTRPVSSEQLASVGSDHLSNELWGLKWTQVPMNFTITGSAPTQIGIVGDLNTDVEPLAISTATLSVECYHDMRALDEAVEGNVTMPEMVLLGAAERSPNPIDDKDPGAIYQVTQRVLGLAQDWLTNERMADTWLVIVTCGAVATRDGETPGLAGAAAWGLLRSAQAEHPDRFALLDMDNSPASWQALPEALALALTMGESQLALRSGEILVPRLAPISEAIRVSDKPVSRPDASGTTLITGGTGGLGALLARHLATKYGVRSLLLASRRGLKAEGAIELRDELVGLGCHVQIATCDVSKKEQLERVIAEIPDAHPLKVVIHAAGVLDDGMIEALDMERLKNVMAPKVDAAVYLHELTKGFGLSDFILFSSVAGTLGNPGQGNYAAANSCLDALATYRRANGLPGQSLAWGQWSKIGGMTVHLDETELARLSRSGMAAFPPERGLELFDRACGIDEPVLLPVSLNGATLRTLAGKGTLPAVLNGLVPSPKHKTSQAEGSLTHRLEHTPEVEWDAIVLELVRNHVAIVLAHQSGDAIHPERPFRELGFDSLTAVEFRNRLNQATGLRLPATLIFDHPTPIAVAKLLHGKLIDTGTVKPSIDKELDKIEEMLASISEDHGARERMGARLRLLLAKLTDDEKPHDDAVTVEMIQSATADGIIDLMHKELP